MKKIILLFLLTAYGVQLTAQKIKSLGKRKNTSLRGLSVVDDNIFWVSGTNGCVGLSTNGGKKIHWMTIAGFEKRDFRDIEAFDDRTAIIMAVDNPAVILKTTDAGQNWIKVYEKDTPGMFLDAMTFDEEHGICIGDPIDGRFWIIETFDKGDTWEETPVLFKPEAKKGEALFASSGSNLRFLNGDNKYQWGFVTGGTASRLFLISDDINTPPFIKRLEMLQGKESQGANSLAINGKNWFIVGGDFLHPGLDSGNHVFTGDGGKTWEITFNGPKGYKSSVTWKTDSTLIACGTSGVAISVHRINDWMTISSKQFHTVQKAKNGTAVYLAGSKGRIAILKD